MKKWFVTLVIIAAFCGGAFIVYKLYLPNMVAEAILAEELPRFIPKQIQQKIDEFRKPLNKGTTEMVTEMHEANISLNDLLQTIDETTEEQAYAMLDELIKSKVTSTDQAFDIGKKHFPVEYDVEVFRESFNENIDLKTIKKAIKYASINRKSKDIDINTLKIIAKMILIEKEKEYRKSTGRQISRQ